MEIDIFEEVFAKKKKKKEKKRKWISSTKRWKTIRLLAESVVLIVLVIRLILFQPNIFVLFGEMVLMSFFAFDMLLVLTTEFKIEDFLLLSYRTIGSRIFLRIFNMLTGVVLYFVVVAYYFDVFRASMVFVVYLVAVVFNEYFVHRYISSMDWKMDVLRSKSIYGRYIEGFFKKKKYALLVRIFGKENIYRRLRETVVLFYLIPYVVAFSVIFWILDFYEIYYVFVVFVVSLLAVFWMPRRILNKFLSVRNRIDTDLGWFLLSSIPIASVSNMDIFGTKIVDAFDSIKMEAMRFYFYKNRLGSDIEALRKLISEAPSVFYANFLRDYLIQLSARSLRQFVQWANSTMGMVLRMVSENLERFVKGIGSLIEGLMFVPLMMIILGLVVSIFKPQMGYYIIVSVASMIVFYVLMLIPVFEARTPEVFKVQYFNEYYSVVIGFLTAIVFMFFFGLEGIVFGLLGFLLSRVVIMYRYKVALDRQINELFRYVEDLITYLRRGHVSQSALASTYSSLQSNYSSEFRGFISELQRYLASGRDLNELIKIKRSGVPRLSDALFRTYIGSVFIYFIEAFKYRVDPAVVDMFFLSMRKFEEMFDGYKKAVGGKSLQVLFLGIMTGMMFLFVPYLFKIFAEAGIAESLGDISHIGSYQGVNINFVKQLSVMFSGLTVEYVKNLARIIGVVVFIVGFSFGLFANKIRYGSVFGYPLLVFIGSLISLLASYFTLKMMFGISLFSLLGG